MKFNETETAKVYNLTLNDVEIEFIQDSLTVLIVPNNNEYPIESYEFDLLEHAQFFINELQYTHTGLVITAVETDGSSHYAVIGDEKIEISRRDYFRILLIDEDERETEIDDVADNFQQVLSGNLAF